MSFGAYIEGHILEHFLRGISMPQETLYLCLLYFSSWTGYTTEVRDPGVDGYERMLIPPTEWSVSAGVASNINLITFPIATANWGVVNALGLIDSPTTLWSWRHGDDPPGKYVTGFAFTTDQEGTGPVYAGQSVSIPPGGISIRQDGFEERPEGRMGAFTNFAENAIMKHIFPQQTYQTPTIWMGLLDGPQLESATNNNCGELPFEDGYHRVVVGDWARWDIEQPQGLVNSYTVLFPEATADWNTESEFGFWFGLFDVASPSEAGNLLIFGSLTAIYFGPAVPLYTVYAGMAPLFRPYNLFVYFSW